MRQILFLSLLFSIFTLTADADKNWGGRDEMNGIHLKDFPDFENKWNLVTVRYRKDIGELRFTYANPQAWQALMNKSVDYPDGSVFAKIGMLTIDDSAFPSSMVPAGAKRFQFMVKDKKKYPDTDGWGYALFDATGVTLNEEPNAKSVACHACHKIVPDRGFVFSEPAAINPFVNKYRATHANEQNRLNFRDGTAVELPPELQEKLPRGTSKLRFLTGDIQKNLFEGTLNEIRPALAVESLKFGLPAILLSADKRSFSLVFTASTPEKGCLEKEAAKEMTAIFSFAIKDEKNSSKLKEKKQIAMQNFCWK